MMKMQSTQTKNDKNRKNLKNKVLVVKPKHQEQKLKQRITTKCLRKGQKSVQGPNQAHRKLMTLSYLQVRNKKMPRVQLNLTLLSSYLQLKLAWKQAH